MRLKEKRTIDLGNVSRLEAENRLYGWAERYGFVGDEFDTGENTFVFRRGSQWQALYTFDIRKIPTVVTIEFSGAESEPSTAFTVEPSGKRSTLWATCRIEIRSWLQFATSGDPQRLAEQFDLLEASLRGALP